VSAQRSEHGPLRGPGPLKVDRLDERDVRSLPSRALGKLFNGRLTWVGDWNGDAQLNGSGQGTGVFEVGTWDSSGAFTPSPSGGTWVTKWEVFVNPAGHYTGKVIGHGVAGEVDGMQFDAALAWTGPGVEDYTIQFLDPHGQVGARQLPSRTPFGQSCEPSGTRGDSVSR